MPVAHFSRPFHAIAASALATALLIACQPKVIGPASGPTASTPTDAGSGNFDAGSSTPDTATPDTGGTVTPDCNGACGAIQFDLCTCDPSDPCNWREDGYCDENNCAQITASYFDDGNDCDPAQVDPPPPVDCDGACGRGEYTDCTCSPTDPCNWAGDNYCDSRCEEVLPGASFDDSADCGGNPPPPAEACGGDCEAGTLNACTCSSSDPCGWVGNSSCEATSCRSLVGAGAFNDSADCGSWDPTPEGDEDYALTAVYDDLDNGDLEVMASGLPGLGFSQAVRDTNVSEETLAGYLARDLTLLYHTGHGLEGEVMTSTYALSPASGSIAVAHTIFATCLTLQHSWASAFGSTAQTLFGYTEVSYDFVDDEVQQDFLSYLNSGRDYLQAWYLSNISQSMLNDRWAAYVREGSSIVEYSARSSHKPSGVLAGTLRGLSAEPSGRIRALAGLLEDPRQFDIAPSRTLRWQGLSPSARFDAGGWSLLGTRPLGPKQALARAEQRLRDALGELPTDAWPAGVVEITAREGEQRARVVGRLVRFERRLEGLPVLANGRADQLAVLVGTRGVAAVQIHWPERELPARSNADTPALGLLLRRVAPQLARRAKGPLLIVGAEPAWGVVPGERQLVPAWALITRSGQRLVISAESGKLL